MQTIELNSPEFLLSLSSSKRDDIVNGIVNNVMSGEYVYKDTIENWNAKDVIADALGNDYVTGKLTSAAMHLNSFESVIAIQELSYKAREQLTGIVRSYCWQNNIGEE